MGDQLPEFVELLHCIFLVHPEAVADTFAEHGGVLQDILEAIEMEPGQHPPFDPSPEDDAEAVPDYVEFLLSAFTTDPGDVMRAFWGHERFLAAVIAMIEGGEAPATHTVTAADLDGMPAVGLLGVLETEGVSAVRKLQAATLLKSNLWTDAENPPRLLAAKVVTGLLGVLQRHMDEDELLAKCCQILESLFTYKGVMPQADAASRQLIKGTYLIYAGKTWDPASFNCGKAGTPITGGGNTAFYAIDRIPYLPSSLTDAETTGLTLQHVQVVEPNETEDPGAALPFIEQLTEENSLKAFVEAVAANFKIAYDDFVLQSAAKVIAAMARLDATFFAQLLQVLDPPTEGGVALLCYCCSLKGTFTDDFVRPFKPDLVPLVKSQCPRKDLVALLQSGGGEAKGTSGGLVSMLRPQSAGKAPSADASPLPPDLVKRIVALLDRLEAL